MTHHDVSPASPNDFDEVKALLDIANNYSATKSDETQWTAMDATYSRLKQEIEKGYCFVYRDAHGEICASISLSDNDRYMWGDDGEDGQALYFHKLMKNPATAPPGVGITLLDFAARETIAKKKKYLRCDTKANQSHLVQFYESIGMRSVRTTLYPTTGKNAVLLQADPKIILKKISASAPREVPTNDTELYAIETEAIRASPVVFDTGTPEEFVEFLEKDGASLTYIWHDKNGCSVGYLALSNLYDSQAFEVRSIAVVPDHQGAGYGTEMMVFTEEIALQHGKNVITLVTSPENDSALAFYKKLGYHVQEEVPNYYGDGTPRLLLQKTLRKKN